MVFSKPPTAYQLGAFFMDETYVTDLNHHAAEAAATSAGKITGLSSVGLVVYGGLTVQEWGVVAGVVIGTLGLITQGLLTWHFNSQKLKLERIRLENDINPQSNHAENGKD